MEDDTPVVESRQIVSSEVTEVAEAAPARGAVAVPGAGRPEQAGDMAQSYHEIFDTQGYSGHGAQAGEEDSSAVNTVQVADTFHLAEKMCPSVHKFRYNFPELCS